MAVSTITYADKVTLNSNPDIAAVNKCQASDMNEIKTVVNNNANGVGDISTLQTTATTVVGAINEVKQKGDYVVLAESISTNYQTIEVEDLNNFSGFILQVSGAVGGGYRPLSSTFCTNQQFKSTASTNYMACSYAGEPATYNTNCYYVNDTHVAIKVGNSTYAGGAFYGIRK